jgi:hypothetical protein
MTARRRLPATLGRLSIAAAAVVALTGCERPAPIVTVVSGTTSEWKEADVYCFDGQSLDSEDCARRSAETPRVEVSGQRIGVDVSKTVAERGWFIEVGGADGQGQRSELQLDRHYASFTFGALPPEGLRMTVKTLGRDGPRGEHTGEWTFDLFPQ